MVYQTWSLYPSEGATVNTETTVYLNHHSGHFPLDEFGSPASLQTTWSTDPPEAKEAMCLSGDWVLEKNSFCEVLGFEFDAGSYKTLAEVHAMLGLDGSSTEVLELLELPLLNVDHLLHLNPVPTCEPFSSESGHICETLTFGGVGPDVLDPDVCIPQHDICTPQSYAELEAHAASRNESDPDSGPDHLIDGPCRDEGGKETMESSDAGPEDIKLCQGAVCASTAHNDARRQTRVSRHRKNTTLTCLALILLGIAICVKACTSIGKSKAGTYFVYRQLQYN